MKQLIIVIATVLSSTAFANNLYKTKLIDCVPTDQNDPMAINFTLIGSQIPNSDQIAVRVAHENSGVLFMEVFGTFVPGNFAPAPIVYSGPKDNGQDFRFAVTTIYPHSGRVAGRLFARHFYAMDLNEDVICQVRPAVSQN